MKIRKTMKRLRAEYPDKKIISKNGMIVKSGKFLVWTKRGEVDISLLPEILNR